MRCDVQTFYEPPSDAVLRRWLRRARARCAVLVRWHRGPLRELLRGGLQKWQPSFATRLLFDCGFDELGEQRERAINRGARELGALGCTSTTRPASFEVAGWVTATLAITAKSRLRSRPQHSCPRKNPRRTHDDMDFL